MRVELPPTTGAASSGATVYTYVANTVTITDPAGRWKKYTTDGFGNLTQVDEPKPSPQTGNYSTFYTYNQFNQLRTVTMTRDGFNGNTPTTLTQPREFEYENGRLKWMKNPETPLMANGHSTEYQYNGALLTCKLDYKGARLYIYDAQKHLERVERYPGATTCNQANNDDKPGRVKYYYNGHSLSTDFVGQNLNGRLAAIEYNFDVAGFPRYREFYSYTVGGKLTKKRLEVPGGKLDVSFEYDAEGKMQYMTYPSGKRVKYTYDDLMRHTKLQDVQGATETDIVNNLTYGVAGELKSMSWYVSPTQPFATQNWFYNSRLQMTQYQYSGPDGSVNHSYIYRDAELKNDGKLYQRLDNISGERVEYQYDSIHRLTSAGVVAGSIPPAQAWTQQYNYDGFGNLKEKTGTGLAASWSFNNAIDSSTNNRPLNGAPDPGDIDNRILSYNGEVYAYAPDNKRIMKDVADGSPTGRKQLWTLWVGNMRVGTYTFTLNSETYVFGVVKEELYVAGRRVAPSDRLGSDLTGGVRLLPYGEDIASPPVANDRTKFATYHRDATGLDYADQRYYSPGSGRFLTADPYVASGGTASPSSWNRYVYTRGDPINRYDPRGLEDEGPPVLKCVVNGNEYTGSMCELVWQTLGESPNEQGRSGDRANLSPDEWRVQRTLDRLITAIQDASEALKRNPECVGLFKNSGGAIHPEALLRALSSGTSSWGYFTLDEIVSKPGQTEVDPAFWTGSLSGRAALKMEETQCRGHERTTRRA